MSGEPQAPSSHQRTAGWPVNWALIIAAGICLLTSLGLAIADRVAAGTLTAGLFVVCVLFYYLPQMESFKAYGIEKWRGVKESEEEVRHVVATVEHLREELRDKIEANASKEELVDTSKKLDTAITQLATANNALSSALTAIDLTTGSPDLGVPSLGRNPNRSNCLPGSEYPVERLAASLGHHVAAGRCNKKQTPLGFNMRKRLCPIVHLTPPTPAAASPWRLQRWPGPRI
jgi:hypothetical protein